MELLWDFKKFSEGALEISKCWIQYIVAHSNRLTGKIRASHSRVDACFWAEEASGGKWAASWSARHRKGAPTKPWRPRRDHPPGWGRPQRCPSGFLALPGPALAPHLLPSPLGNAWGGGGGNDRWIEQNGLPSHKRWPDCLELRCWSFVSGLKLRQQLFLCPVSTGFLD